MSAWILVPCLVSLRTEFNLVAPGRDKGADGAIGDSAHTSASDHTPDEDSDVLRDHDGDSKNEVHALDIDSSGPWPEAGWFGRAVLGIVAREKVRWLDPDDVCRLEYVIWNRKIYSRAYDFRERDYTGADPHTGHTHFSSRYLTTAENDTRPWGLLEEDPEMDYTREQLQAFPWQLQARDAQGGDPNMSTLAVLNGTYTAAKATLAALTATAAAEAQRDAAQNATLAGMVTLLQTVAAANGALTEAQMSALTEQVRSAATAAGRQAAAIVEAKVDAVDQHLAALREHLGDEG